MNSVAGHADGQDGRGGVGAFSMSGLPAGPPRVSHGRSISAISTSMRKGVSMRFLPAVNETGVGPLMQQAKFSRNMTLGEFFFEDLQLLRQVHQDVNAMSSDIAGVKAASDRMRDLLSSLSDSQMNRTIYALTLVTTLSIPFTVVSGYFGMNFEDMNELFTDSKPQTAVGFRLFWYVVGCMLTLLLIAFWRAGFYRAIL
jgi:hypothetical protein